MCVLQPTGKCTFNYRAARRCRRGPKAGRLSEGCTTGSSDHIMIPITVVNKPESEVKIWTVSLKWPQKFVVFLWRRRLNCNLSVTSQRPALAALDYTVQCSPNGECSICFTVYLECFHNELPFKHFNLQPAQTPPPPFSWSCFIQVHSNLQRAAVSKILILAAPIIVVCLPILWGKIKGGQQVQSYFRRSHLSYCVRIILTVCVCASLSAATQAAEERQIIK